MVSNSGNREATLVRFLVLTGEQLKWEQTLRHKARNREIGVGYNWINSSKVRYIKNLFLPGRWLELWFWRPFSHRPLCKFLRLRLSTCEYTCFITGCMLDKNSLPSFHDSTLAVECKTSFETQFPQGILGIEDSYIVYLRVCVFSLNV